MSGISLQSMEQTKMNRAARRYASKYTAPVEINFGRCIFKPSERPFTCFVCEGEVHPWPWSDGPTDVGHGLAQITCHCGKCTPINAPLCECCFGDPDATGAGIMRKVTGNPELEFKKGGFYSSVEQLTQDLATDPSGSSKH
jgi:hypothetical protein